MTLWRISGHRRLQGAGGLLAPGRWHTQGLRIVYCAPNPATALVEVLVHVEIEAGDLPDPLQYLEIEAHAVSTSLLRVPSVIVPATWNVLIDPRHPESTNIRVDRVHSHGIDPRLL